jgi:long-chain acyl-CoA synthetase
MFRRSPSKTKSPSISPLHSTALDAVNPTLPHYRQIRNFALIRDPLTAETGLLTAMGKLRRDAINARFASEINSMYDRKPS